MGRRPYPLGKLLRIHFLQWYSLSDERMEEEWIDVAMVRAFAGSDLPEGSVADGRTILSFLARNLPSDCFEAQACAASEGTGRTH